ncbi:MAG TPA: regulatory signaling modulator protein AmpE [Cellvibrio sp.]|nr:regulatory signaling modulator protein AmpE [Cellvibrio sp.]
MIFLSLIAVLAIVYFTDIPAMVQRDGWFIGLINRLRALPAISSAPLLAMILALAIPLALLVLLMLLVIYQGFYLYLFFIYVPVLLYSLGRGNFVADVNTYLAIASRGDSVAAAKLVDELAGRVAIEHDSRETSSWQSLHTQALKVFSYRGFEKTFAVLFWFVIAGPLGALLYRLSVIYREQTIANSAEAQLAEKWLWLIELPAVRLMGLTWAFVGNFDSCPWRDSLLDTESSSITILNNSLRGALSAPTDAYRVATAEVVDAELAVATVAEPAAESLEAALPDTRSEEAQEAIEDLVGITLSPQVEPAYSFALVKSSVPLYSRSLLFCVGVIAFATLFI